MRSCMNCQHRMNNCNEWGEHPECTRYLERSPTEHKAPRRGGRYKDNEYGGKYNAPVSDTKKAADRKFHSTAPKRVHVAAENKKNSKYNSSYKSDTPADVTLPFQYKLIKPGQRLYYRNKNTEVIESGIVVKKEPQSFSFQFKERKVVLTYDFIGTRLFLNKRIPEK